MCKPGNFPLMYCSGPDPICRLCFLLSYCKLISEVFCDQHAASRQIAAALRHEALVQCRSQRR